MPSDPKKSKGFTINVKLDGIIIEITPYCNFKCSYCILGDNPPAPIDFASWFKALQSFLDVVFLIREDSAMRISEIDNIILTGGEPTLGFPGIIFSENGAVKKVTPFDRTLIVGRFLRAKFPKSRIILSSNGSAPPMAYKILKRAFDPHIIITKDKVHQEELKKLGIDPDKQYNEILKSAKQVSYYIPKTLIASGRAYKRIVHPDNIPGLWNPKITQSEPISKESVQRGETKIEILSSSDEQTGHFPLIDSRGRFIIMPDVCFEMRDEFTIGNIFVDNIYHLARKAQQQMNYFDGVRKNRWVPNKREKKILVN